MVNLSRDITNKIRDKKGEITEDEVSWNSSEDKITVLLVFKMIIPVIDLHVAMMDLAKNTGNLPLS